jgi:hypothetical protein
VAAPAPSQTQLRGTSCPCEIPSWSELSWSWCTVRGYKQDTTRQGRVTDSFVSRESTARNHTWTLQISKIQIRHDLYTCILLNTTEYTQFAMCHCLLRLYIQSCLTRRNIIHMLTQIIHRLRFSSVCSTAKGYKQINKQGRVQN